MNRKDATRRIQPGRFIASAIALLFAMVFAPAPPGQQPQHSAASREKPVMEPIRRLYVDSFEGKVGSAQLRESVVARLRADKQWQIVDKPEEADAVVHGNGEMWVKGYITTSPRSKSSIEPEYAGYLSLEIRSRSGETLWSYLVTPGRMHWNGVDRDMADHIVRVMNAALAGGNVPDAGPAAASATQVSLAGAGSTFAAPLYQKWIESFEDVRPGIRLSYQATGSESGIEDLEQARIDFAASDVPLTDGQMARMKGKIDQYATVLGGVVAAYNLAGLGRDVRFSPEVLAEIYLGKITRWNDERLRAINRGANLPNEPIVVVHRSDGSGTSYAWTEFLSKASAEWKGSAGTGMKVAWPAGEGAEGNEGVAAKVSQTPGAIGYMELTYALRHQLSFGQVRNAAGDFVQANLTTLGDAAKYAARAGDLRRSLIDAPGRGAYPIATFTWILVPESGESTQKSGAIRDLARWMLTDGQKECAGLGYLPLPREVAEAELRRLGAPGH